MFGAYLQGFIGLIMVVVGIPVFLLGLIAVLTFGNSEGGGPLLIGFVLTFGGGYMSYLSKQTHRSIDMYGSPDDVSQLSKNPQTQISQKVDRASSTHDQFDGLRDTNSEEYMLHLVEKYNIKKNETMNRFVFDKKPFNELSGAIEAAHKVEDEAFATNGMVHNDDGHFPDLEVAAASTNSNVIGKPFHGSVAVSTFVSRGGETIRVYRIADGKFVVRSKEQGESLFPSVEAARKKYNEF
jgi:hypothetical protein